MRKEKQMKKQITRFIAVLLSMCMILGMVTVASAAENTGFKDVQDDSQYYYAPVYWAAENGITKGYSDNTFGIGKECERREMMIFLWRMAGCPSSKTDPTKEFKDMGAYGSSTDTYKAVGWGVENDIIKGYPDGTFRPKDPVARKDTLIMLYRIAGRPEVKGTITYSDVPYTEAKTPDTYHAILWAQQEEITKGYADKTFRPLESCLREQIVTFIYRAQSHGEQISADDAIVGVKTIGYVDLEGAKVNAIVLEYDREIDGTSVSEDAFTASDYTSIQLAYSGASAIELDYDGIEGNEGAIERVYVNDKEEMAEEGAAKGKYVIIEVNTAFMLNGQNLAFTSSMAGGAQQVGTIKAADGTEITPASKEARNYTLTESEGRNGSIQASLSVPKELIILPEFAEGSGWTLHYKEDGTAFPATNCYSEYTDTYCDFDMPYSIYVPDQETMEANKGDIALVIHMEHAGGNDTDPLSAVTSSKAAVKLSGETVQSRTPAIVVVPQIEESRRSTNDYDASSEANTAVWELIDSLLEQYKGYINENRIYGTGQSMGGMTILNMAAQRDNFFGGIAVIGGQWSNNYDKTFQNEGLRTPEKDEISFDVANGGFGEHDIAWYAANFENWYYMISDDNIFIHTCVGDAMAHGEWKDTAKYYKEIGGVEVPYAEYDPYLPLEEQNAIDKELTDHDNTTPGSGLNWAGFTKGNHMSTWKYAYALDYSFEWLFSQSRETANARGKIEELNKPWLGLNEDGSLKEGTGTVGLNSAQFTPNGASTVFTEGWTKVSVLVNYIDSLQEDAEWLNSKERNANGTRIEEAWSMYDRLNDEEKAQITNFDRLKELQKLVDESQAS